MDLLCWFVLCVVLGLSVLTLSVYLDLRDERERSANLTRRLELLKTVMLRHGLEP